MPDEGQCKRDCEEGISYKNYDVDRKILPDLDACMKHCKNIPGAKFIEFNIVWSCLCKSSDADRTKDADAISCPI